VSRKTLKKEGLLIWGTAEDIARKSAGGLLPIKILLTSGGLDLTISQRSLSLVRRSFVEEIFFFCVKLCICRDRLGLG